MKLVKIVKGIAKGIFLWLGIAITVIGYTEESYAFLSLGFIIVYCILNELEKKKVEDEN